MPKGFTTLPDGRVVGSKSNELKEYVAANPDFQTSRVKTPTPETEGESFSAPPPPIGTPKTVVDNKPSKAQSKEQAKNEEIEDYKQLVAALFGGVAALAGSPVYLFSEPECEAIAKPLARIVARNSALKKVVGTVADPVALFAAVAFPLGVKYSIHQEEIKAARARNVTGGMVGNVNKGPIPTEEYVQPSPSPVSSFDDALSKIANTA